MPAADAVADEIYGFLMERLRAYYLEGAGGTAAPGRVAVTTEMFDAVLAARPASPADFDARLRALSTFLDLPEAASLTAANKRIANILKKSADPVQAQADPALFTEAAERALWTDVGTVRRSADVLFEAGDYASSLKALAALRTPVDKFFDDVMVNAEDPKVRANRLGLLATLHGVMNRVADLSRLSA
jgi:glycyl-tRNA synthetase beta chain